MRFIIGLFIAVFLSLNCSLRADDKPSTAPAVPVTRQDVKAMLEAWKKVTPRLPLPPLSEEEKKQQGDRPVVNNGRMHQLYLAPELRGGGWSRDPDPAMSLDNTFKTQLFWIVSRANNCRYCLGHQEIKLAVAGQSDDEIAALDGDWSEFSEAERAAFRFTRRLAHEPHLVTAADLERLRPHYKDLQQLEIILSVAGFAAMNRWTETLAIPGEEDGSGLMRATGKPKAEYKTFLRPTSDKYRGLVSKVAPLGDASTKAGICRPVPAERPALEDRSEVEAALAACRKRTPRLPLVEEDKARALLPADPSRGPLPHWVRLLANFPKAGVARINTLSAAAEKGKLDARLKAQIAWIAARQDRAWYAVGHAKRRLQSLGFSDDAIYALDGSWDSHPAAERAVFNLTRKVTTAPMAIEDADVAAVRRHLSDGETAEVIYQITQAAFFDRLTEASGLQLESTR